MRYLLSKPQSIQELGQRANQEDTIFPEPDKSTATDRLFIVCDGMGGHESGEVASSTVCQVLSEYILKHTNSDEEFTPEQFNEALNVAYEELDKKDNGAGKKMGTTLALLRFHRSGCLIAHIGDSRIYHVRPSEKYIFHTRDHSLVNDLYDIGEITQEEMQTSKQKNVITRAMQPNQERRVKADIRNITDIRPGDYFYLCSDGMLEEMEDENLLNILSDTSTTDEEKREILIKATASNRDNHSAHLIHVLKVIKEKSEQPLKNTIGDTTSIPSQKKFLKVITTILFAVIIFLIAYLATTLFIK